MTKSIDEWAANACNVKEAQKYVNKPMFSITPAFVYKDKWHQYRWTIKDPRCREKFFSHLLNDGYCVFMEKDSRGVCIEISKHGIDPNTHAYLKDTCGESIEEASVEAITAIYEAEK